MDVLSDLFGSGGGDKKSPSSGGGPEANAFKFEVPISSTASSQASGWQGPIRFGSYSSSPIFGSGNSPVTGGGYVGNELPVWIWPVALIGAFLLAKKGSK